MIYLEKIQIQEFRGIRSLTINFASNNFAICGRNGTGKSGVVDAIEYGLTGNISRLSGSGTGGISLKAHAPHVDSRDNPERSFVILTVKIISSGEEVIIKRSVNEPFSPEISSKNPATLRILKSIAAHPEFTLSRRELIKYVISAPGDRAKEIQSLLQLDKVENLRVVAQRIFNASKREVLSFKTQKETAQEQLSQALEITELNNTKLLEAVNQRRSALGLVNISVLTKSTSLKDGLATPAPNLQNIPKSQILKAINNVRELQVQYCAAENITLLEDVKKDLGKIKSDYFSLANITRDQFLNSAIASIEDDKCPVCDTPWDVSQLRELIKNKLKKFDSSQKIIESCKKKVDPYIQISEKFYNTLYSLSMFRDLFKEKFDFQPFVDFAKELKERETIFAQFVSIKGVLDKIDHLFDIPESLDGLLKKIEEYVSSLPNTEIKDSARDYLIISQERLDRYREVSLKYKRAEEEADIAEKVFRAFADASTEVLNNIYKTVEADFTELYSFINNEDEQDFSAELKPSIGKLSFDVNFYGRGFFPPGAYHSEGHQDGMGLCLYLALMKHLQGNDFTFAVLDDVVMSVDSGHRREVCKLLREKFPKTQFIITTHDQVWLKHMKTAGLIKPKSSIFFKTWCVENGPSEWNDRNVWEEIQDDIALNNIREAATTLRFYLEYISSEICHHLRASVEFHGDGQFDLGDLLPAAIGRFKQLLSSSMKNSTLWGKDKEAELIKQRLDEFITAVTESQVEQWQTNSSIHYNEWVNLQENDFRPVVEAFKSLIILFFCNESKCDGIIFATPAKGNIDSIRCSCGTINYNLVKPSDNRSKLSTK